MSFKQFIIVATSLSFSLGLAEEKISLVPEEVLGIREAGHLNFKEIIWKTDSEWFHRPAPVCKVVEKPLDLSLIINEAKKRGMVPNPTHRLGTEEDGAVDYHTTAPPWLGAGGVSKKRYFFFGYAKFDDFERDEYQMAIVKPLPSRKESIALCRRWMERLGIDEGQFYRGGDWPEGFDISETRPRVTRMHPVTKRDVVSEYGLQLRFCQQIGGLPVLWDGSGGNLIFSIADGGEFCGVRGCLRAWEKIGDYPVLNRGEIEQAIQDGFAWVHEPIRCEALEIVAVTLEAYHSNWKTPQTDFPLVYRLTCKLRGGANQNLEKSISIPALQQHRDRYPLPPPANQTSPDKETEQNAEKPHRTPW